MKKESVINPLDSQLIEALLAKFAVNWMQEVRRLENQGDLPKLCIGWLQICDAHDRIDALRKQLYAITEAIDACVISALDKAGVDKIAVPEVARSFYPLDKYTGSVVDKEKGYKWLRDNNAAALITETVNAQTLGAFLRDLILTKGLEPPEDALLFKPYKIVGSSKYKPKPNLTALSQGTKKQRNK